MGNRETRSKECEVVGRREDEYRNAEEGALLYKERHKGSAVKKEGNTTDHEEH